jgi:hypothetical protein
METERSSTWRQKQTYMALILFREEGWGDQRAANFVGTNSELQLYGRELKIPVRRGAILWESALSPGPCRTLKLTNEPLIIFGSCKQLIFQTFLTFHTELTNHYPVKLF